MSRLMHFLTVIGVVSFALLWLSATAEEHKSESAAETVIEIVPINRTAAAAAPPRLPMVLTYEKGEHVKPWKPVKDLVVDDVLHGMERLASSEWPWSLEALTRHWGNAIKPRQLAEQIYEQSMKYNIDPFILLAIFWQESHLNPIAQGDCSVKCVDENGYHKEKCEKGDRRYRRCKSCGIAQINTDADPSRPGCQQAMSTKVAIPWASNKLSLARDYENEYRGRLLIHRYNSNSEKASWDYERDIWRTMELARGNHPVGREYILNLGRRSPEKKKKRAKKRRYDS